MHTSETLLRPFFFFFFNDTATTEIYTLSLHDALPISHPPEQGYRVQGPSGRIRRDTRVQRLARTDRGVQRAHRLLERRVRVVPVGVEDVDVLQAHPAQRLVQAGQQVLARAVVAVGARPHVVARLGR